MKDFFSLTFESVLQLPENISFFLGPKFAFSHGMRVLRVFLKSLLFVQLLSPALADVISYETDDEVVWQVSDLPVQNRIFLEKAVVNVQKDVKANEFNRSLAAATFSSHEFQCEKNEANQFNLIKETTTKNHKNHFVTTQEVVSENLASNDCQNLKRYFGSL